MSRFAGLRLVAVGHVTNDLLASGPAPGGSALYAALAARALGAEATVVTACGRDFGGRALLEEAGVQLRLIESPRTSTFENRYQGGRRSERLLARAEPIPGLELEADVLLLCPVIGELDPAWLLPSRTPWVGAGLQGFLRRTGEGGRIEPAPLGDPARFAHCHALFLSEHDLAPADPVARLVEAHPLVVLTRGEQGARVFLDRQPHEVPAAPAREIDPTGAGDVFATGFLLALAAGAAPLEAADFACRAAAIAVEGVGPTSLPRLSALSS